MNRLKTLLTLPLLLPGPGLAGNDLDGIDNLVQSQFRLLAKNVVSASTYKATAPAEPLGITGFDIGIGLSTIDLDKEVFELASTGGWDYSYLPVPRLYAQKGLPFGIDVGVSYSAIPDVDIKIFGMELKYALLSGSIATPAVAVRLSYSKLDGIDELDVENKGIDLSVSKGFAMLTPYAGIGRTFSRATPVNVPLLRKEDIEDSVIYAGLNINLGVNIGLEINQTAGVTSYSGKVGVRF